MFSERMWTVGGAWSNPTQPFSLFSIFKSNTKQQHEHQREIHICLYHMEMTGLKGRLRSRNEQTGWYKEGQAATAGRQNQHGKTDQTQSPKLEIRHRNKAWTLTRGQDEQDKDINTRQGWNQSGLRRLKTKEGVRTGSDRVASDPLWCPGNVSVLFETRRFTQEMRK